MHSKVKRGCQGRTDSIHSVVSLTHPYMHTYIHTHTHTHTHTHSIHISFTLTKKRAVNMDAKNTLFPHPVSYLVGVPCRRSHQFSGRSGATSTSTSRSKEANNESINQSTIKSTLQCTLHYSVHYTTVYTTLTAS
jgi:hypothetical protein